MAGIKFFQIYLDCKQHIDMLSDEQAGKIFKSLFDFAISGEIPDFSDGMLTMCFSFLAAQIERDTTKYTEKCERNRQIALERERRKRERNNTNVQECEQPSANVHEQHQEKEEEKEKEKEKEEEEEKEEKKEKKKENNKSAVQTECDFEECWAVYPRKQDKAVARKVYLKLAKKDPELKEKVIAGIKKYVEHIRKNGTDIQYIKKGGNYFKGECWNDNYDVEGDEENGETPVLRGRVF